MTKKLTTFLITAILTLASINCAFASSTGVYTKDTSFADIVKGEITFEKNTDISVENEKAPSITTKKVTINKQEIKGDGQAVIKDNSKTTYKNSKALAIVDLNVDITAPIVHGDTDIIIERQTDTELDNVEAEYFYGYDYSYVNPIRLPF